MDVFQNPVGAPDPYEKYRAEPTQEKNPSPSSPEQETVSMGVVAYFVDAVRTLLFWFLEEEKTPSIEKKSKARSLFKERLQELTLLDKSQDTRFLQSLSEEWNKVLQEQKMLPPSSNAHPLKELISRIKSYRGTHEYSLGYYLSEFAGKTWTPFPYIELIHKLHMEHTKIPHSSQLAIWIALLDRSLRD